MIRDRRENFGYLNSILHDYKNDCQSFQLPSFNRKFENQKWNNPYFPSWVIFFGKGNKNFSIKKK